MGSSSILLKNKKETKYYENEIVSDKVTNSLTIKSGVKTLTPKIIKRIIAVLGHIDIYEDKKSPDCFPDYKFPEIRWDENTRLENIDLMSDEEIKSKFQLLNKEVLQRKKTVCQQCYQSGKRKFAFDIPYFYRGDVNWDKHIPKTGKAAELGCIGCAWYDFAEWRKHLLDVLEK